MSKTRALVGEYKKIKLSYINDVLTIYVIDGFEKDKKLELSSNGKNAKNSVEQIENVTDLFMGYIEEKDDDHKLFHQDTLKKEILHYHVKFADVLDHDSLDKILDIFVKNNLLFTDEKRNFLLIFNKRYEEFRKSFDSALSESEAADKKENSLNIPQQSEVITQFIKDCHCNDLLIHLHNYLLTEKFDYLRVGKGWNGTGAQNQPIKTGEHWAHIQELITEQMGFNVINDCDEFTSQLAVNYACIWNRTHHFISLYRSEVETEKDLPKVPEYTEPVNSFFYNFRNGNREDCTEIYKKSFTNFGNK